MFFRKLDGHYDIIITMEKNKSIDGLSFKRDKKNNSPKVGVDGVAQKEKTVKVVEKKIEKKPVKTVKVIEVSPEKKQIEVTEPIVENKTKTEDFLKPVEAFDFDNNEKKLKDHKEKIEEKSDIKTTKKELKKVKKAEKKQKKSKAKKIIEWIVLIVVLLLIAGVVYVFVWGNDIISKLTGGKSDIWGAIGTLFDENYEPLATDKNGRTNILAFGTSGYNMAGDEGNGVHDGAQLTDSIMMISVDQNSGDIAMLSLPRDLKASQACTATGKINEVYWCHNLNGDNEAAGAQALMDEVGNVLGIDFQYYAHINWESLIEIVDTLGGIKITLDEDINDVEWTGAVYQAGVEYELNGLQAIGLARARHGTEGGDFSRGNSQQKILIGIKDKIYAANLGFVELLGIVNTLGDNLRTNLSVDNFKTAIHLTYEFDFDNMRQLPLVDYNKNIYYMTTGMINGISYVLPSAGIGNYSIIREYVAHELISDPIKREDATILVLNGTDVSGVAAKEREVLIEAGYNVKNIGDAPKTEYPEDYMIYYVSDEVPGTIKSLEQYYGVNAVSGTELPDGVSTNYDIVVIVGYADPLPEAEILLED